MRFEIPAFPVLIPTAAIVFGILVWRLRRRQALTIPRVVLALMLCVYAVGALRSVLLPYEVVIGSGRRDLVPWTAFVQLIPLATVPQDPSGMVLNVALFIPFGFLAPLLLRRPTFVRALVAGLALSASIELVQLLGDVTISTGRVADVDDLIGNVVGTAVGWLVFRMAATIRPIGRRVPALRWPQESGALESGTGIPARAMSREGTSS